MFTLPAIFPPRSVLSRLHPVVDRTRRAAFVSVLSDGSGCCPVFSNIKGAPARSFVSSTQRFVCALNTTSFSHVDVGDM